MVSKVTTWFKHLSKIGKIGVVMAVVAAVAVVAPANSQQPAKAPTAATQTVPATETKTMTTTELVPFKNVTKNDSTLAKGQTRLTSVGAVGIKTFTYQVTYKNGVETDKKLVKEEVTLQPIDEVTVLGTHVAKPKPAPNCDPNYRPCVPNVSYDLDCADIGMSVTVVGYDKHGFDGNDNDGYGCESY